MADPIIPNKHQHDDAEDQDNFVFAVMPQTGGQMYSGGQQQPPKAPELPHTTQEMPGGMEEHHSIWHSRTTYIIVGILILLVLGAAAYFLLGSELGNKTANTPATSKLPKIFLKTYFGVEVCEDTSVCGDAADPDKDGLGNYDEFVEQTDPKLNDSDSDGLADGDEVAIYLLEPTKKFTDPSTLASQNDYHDGSQVKNGYDPLTPGKKMTETRLAQIQSKIQSIGLHHPTIDTLKAPQNKTVTISIVNNKFDPSPVVLNVNDTINWVNKDVKAHQIASDVHPSHDLLPGLESGILATNQTYSFKFTKAGTFTYHDHLNTAIKGTIEVK
jgi:plastocyanin